MRCIAYTVAKISLDLDVTQISHKKTMKDFDLKEGRRLKQSGMSPGLLEGY